MSELINTLKASATSQIHFLKHITIIFEVLTNKDLNELLSSANFGWLLDLVAADDTSNSPVGFKGTA